MTRQQLWEVRKVHSSAAYNDEDKYAIFDGTGAQITPGSLGYGVRRELFDVIASAHNRCFLTDADDGEKEG